MVRQIGIILYSRSENRCKEFLAVALADFRGMANVRQDRRAPAYQRVLHISISVVNVEQVERMFPLNWRYYLGATEAL